MNETMEKWQEIYSAEELKAVQEIEKENLRVLLDVCRKLNVQPIMYGGSLIGAVRHKGFIPWDDDIDVAMSRCDYDKFIREAPAHLPYEYQLQTPYLEKNSPYPYAKLRRKNTTYIEYVHHKLDISKGVYIDIYPIDNIPDDDDEYGRQYNMVQIVIRLFVLRQTPYLSRPVSNLFDCFKMIVIVIISKMFHLIPLKIWMNCINHLLTKYNSKKTKRQSVLNYPKKENWYGKLYPLKDGVFEEYHVKIPYDWQDHLKRRYGNYMEMPPENKRVGHKPYLLNVDLFMKG